MVGFVAAFSMVFPVAVLPILDIVAGLGEVSKVALIVIGITPFLIRDLAQRVPQIPSEQTVNAQILDASSTAIGLRVALPQTLPRLIQAVRLSMHDFLQEMREETGMTEFMVTHDLSEGFKLGDRVFVFDKEPWGPHDPAAYGATIIYDFDAPNDGIPYQTIEEETHVLQPA